jgi:hypothetical protein
VVVVFRFEAGRGWMPMQAQGEINSGPQTNPRLTPDLEAEVVVQVAMDGGGALVLAGVSACSLFALLSLSSAYFSPAGFDAFLP